MFDPLRVYLVSLWKSYLFPFGKKRCSFPTNHITRPLLLNHVLKPFHSPLNLLFAAVERGNHMETITEVVNSPPPSCGGWVLQANSSHFWGADELMLPAVTNWISPNSCLLPRGEHPKLWMRMHPPHT